MARLNAPYWSSSTSQKFKFISDAGSNFTVQTNPTTYSFSPNSNAEPLIPAVLAPTLINGPLEFAPSAIPLEWQEMSRPDYDTLRTNFNLQLGVMIDAEDNGFYGMLKLGGFNFIIGSAQKVGTVQAIFICIAPANGQTSTINILSTPTAPTPTVGAGGSIPNTTTTYYRQSVWTQWGESLCSTVFSATTTAANQAVTIPWTAPTSPNYRRSRIYAATTSGALANGSQAYVMADVWAPFTQQWIDTTGVNGLTNIATVPSSNKAYLGTFTGGVWLNGS